MKPSELHTLVSGLTITQTINHVKIALRPAAAQEVLRDWIGEVYEGITRAITERPDGSMAYTPALFVRELKSHCRTFGYDFQRTAEIQACVAEADYYAEDPWLAGKILRSFNVYQDITRRDGAPVIRMHNLEPSICILQMGTVVRKLVNHFDLIAYDIVVDEQETRVYDDQENLIAVFARATIEYRRFLGPATGSKWPRAYHQDQACTATLLAQLTGLPVDSFVDARVEHLNMERYRITRNRLLEELPRLTGSRLSDEESPNPWATAVRTIE